MLPLLHIFLRKNIWEVFLYCQLKENNQFDIHKEKLLLTLKICSQSRLRGIYHLPSPLTLLIFSYREEISTTTRMIGLLPYVPLHPTPWVQGREGPTHPSLELQSCVWFCVSGAPTSLQQCDCAFAPASLALRRYTGQNSHLSALSGPTGHDAAVLIKPDCSTVSCSSYTGLMVRTSESSGSEGRVSQGRQ